MNFILRNPQRTTYWKVMFAVSIGFLIITVIMAVAYPFAMQTKLMQRLIISLGVLSFSMIFSTTSELLPIAWRKIAVIFRIISLITMFLAFGIGLSGLSS
ncbi:MAG: hypothetical protein A3K45_00980 [Chloroflexi bacterium RIFOXYC12_FULL_59_14]|nr:MAG: hypothetical protein A3K45_00980 [Chloroflexi bacterium RIFOXYC12_FULL_59_14]